MDFTGIGFLLLFVILMIVFRVLQSRRSEAHLRAIPAFSRLRDAIDLAVEDGSRLHIALGDAEITGPRAAAALVGLSMLNRISKVASQGDHPPIASAGDGTVVILAQDTLRTTYQSLGMFDSYNNTLGRAAGLTPFSYAAGTIPIILDEQVSTNVIAGSFGDEVALLTTTGERSSTLTLAGTDKIQGQAILYATADEQLIGEELYAGGAYVGAGDMHIASLHAQDVIRWLLVVIIIGRAVGGMFGFF
jgi:hypothetical protein